MNRIELRAYRREDGTWEAHAEAERKGGEVKRGEGIGADHQEAIAKALQAVGAIG